VGQRQGTVAWPCWEGAGFSAGWSTLLNEPHMLMLSAVCKKPALLVAFKGTELRGLMTADMQLGFDLLEKLCFLLRERLQLALGVIENLLNASCQRREWINPTWDCRTKKSPNSMN